VEKQIEVFREPKNGEFALHALFGPGGMVASTAVPGLKISLTDLFTK
jgi:hypothetical protein